MLKKSVALLSALMMVIAVFQSAGAAEYGVKAAYSDEKAAEGKCELVISDSVSEAGTDAIVTLAGYNSGKLTYVKKQNVTLTGEQQSVEFDYPRNSGDYRFFVWDDKMAPLADTTDISVTSKNVAAGKSVKALTYSEITGTLDSLTDGNASEDTYWAQSEGGSWAACLYVDLLSGLSVNEINIHIPEAVESLYTEDENSGVMLINLSNSPTANSSDEVAVNVLKKPEAGWHTLKVKDSGKYRFVKIYSFAGRAMGLSEIEVYSTMPQKAVYNVAGGEMVTVAATGTGEGAASNVVDGDENTIWSANGSYNELVIDLGKEYDIKQIKVKSPEKANMSMRYYLSPLDGEGTALDYYFTDLNNAQWVAHSVTDESGVRYLKFTTSGGDVISFSEIQVLSFEKPAEIPIYNISSAAEFTQMEGTGASGTFENLKDGREDTSWTSNAGYSKVKIDLGDLYDLKKIRVKAPEGPAAGYAMQLFDEQFGITPGYYGYISAQFGSEWTEFELPAAIDAAGAKPFGKVRYLYLMSMDGNGLGTISEIEVWSTENIKEDPIYNISSAAEFTQMEGTGASGTFENLKDGREDTSWTSNAGYSKVKIDLGDLYDLKKIRVKAPEGPAAGYAMQLFDEQFGITPGYYGYISAQFGSEWTEFELPAAIDAAGAKPFGKVRYLYLMSMDGNGLGTISEIEVWSSEDIKITNLALGATVEQIEGFTYEGDINSIVDGDENTGWVSHAGGTSKVKIDLGGLYPVKQIKIKSLSDADTTKTYYIQVFDEKFGETPGYYGYITGTNNGEWVTFNLPADMDTAGAKPYGNVQSFNLMSTGEGSISIAEIQIY